MGVDYYSDELELLSFNVLMYGVMKSTPGKSNDTSREASKANS